MGALKFITFVCVAIFADACSMEASSGAAPTGIEESDAPTRYSLKDISRRVNGLDGRMVSVRGYLTSFGPIMILVENEEANPFNQKKSRLLVSDTELRLEIISGDQFFDLVRYFDSLGCVERYADIVGEVGLIGEQEHNGIVKIESIRTYIDENFNDSEELCYSANNN